MSDQGYLYVLANSAMPGLVKVGKTTRTPSERAEELSGVTGLPTPFIVVYEQLFDDCSAAERFVHTLLESRGFRVSSNREFFNAPVNDVVRAILATPGATTGEAMLEEANNVPDGNENPAWMGLMLQADEHYYGLGNTLQDHAEALRLYKQAIKLGGKVAFAVVGKMYENGEGTPANIEEAISYYKQGASNGDVYCYWCMALAFAKTGNNTNMAKCAELFCVRQKDGLHERYMSKIGRDAMDVIMKSFQSRIGEDFAPPIKAMFATMKDPIRKSTATMITYCEQDPDNGWLVSLLQRVDQYVESL